MQSLRLSPSFKSSKRLSYYCTRGSLGSRQESCKHQKVSVPDLKGQKFYTIDQTYQALVQSVADVSPQASRQST